VIDAYLGAHHDVDLGDSTGIERLEEELANDEESVVGTEDEGILGHGVTEVAGGAPSAGPAHKDEEKR
jgi:branched-chain amino acid transport system ATP-binding protein